MERDRIGRAQRQASLENLLAPLDRDQLRRLLLHLAKRYPNLAQGIEDEARLRYSLPASTPEPRRAPPDLAATRRQMSTAFGMSAPSYHSSYSNWHSYGPQLGPEARELLDKVWTLIRGGEGKSALEILGVMADEFLDHFEIVMDDENGEMLDFLGELSPAWTEAALSAELTPDEREEWIARLDDWAMSELTDYDPGMNVAAARQALAKGWDDPALQPILQGEVAEQDHDLSENDHDLEVRRQVTAARLNVLERQGRTAEYLNLARAEGEVTRYTLMLVREGRAAEATEYGMARLEQAEDALKVAQALQESGERERALRIGERGLGLDGKKAELGAWLAGLSREMGRAELALHAATIAFREEQSLASYLRVYELAGAEWPARREELLESLRATRTFYPQGPVDIFLHEGLIDDAIALIDRDSYPSRHLIEQVAAAAIWTRPDWVIQTARKQAEEIMDQKKAAKYDIAASWLAKVRDAYKAAGRDSEWQDYLADLLTKHQRKNKLVPMLRSLG